MTLLCSNGWPAIEDIHQDPNAVLFSAGGRKWWAANHDVYLVAQYLISEYARTVEPITGGQLDDWSWSFRKVTGSATKVSNHAGALAWDINALEHPRGNRDTFTAPKMAAVRTILAFINTLVPGHQIIRWGQDYEHSPTDAMHFEIVATQVIVKRAARALTRNIIPEVVTPMDAQELLKTTIELGPAAARAMGRETFDSETVEYLLLWGGPGLAQIERKLDLISGQLDQLLHPAVDAHPVPPS